MVWKPEINAQSKVMVLFLSLRTHLRITSEISTKTTQTKYLLTRECCVASLNPKNCQKGASYLRTHLPLMHRCGGLQGQSLGQVSQFSPNSGAQLPSPQPAPMASPENRASAVKMKPDKIIMRIDVILSSSLFSHLTIIYSTDMDKKRLRLPVTLGDFQNSRFQVQYFIVMIIPNLKHALPHLPSFCVPFCCLGTLTEITLISNPFLFDPIQFSRRNDIEC